MKKNSKLIIAIIVCFVAAFVFGAQRLSSKDSFLFNMNVEALADSESGNGYVICYHQSKVRIGHTYYDCGTCAKIYDEKGYGLYTKCFK